MNEAKILEAIKSLDQKFEGKFDSLEGKFGSLEGKVDSLEIKFSSLEEQFQGQRADIIEIKEKVLAALDGNSSIPIITDKVEKHGRKIEALEQKVIVFDTVLRNLSK